MAETLSTSAPKTIGAGMQIAYAYAAIGAILFGSKGVAVKLAYADGLDAGTLLTIRLLYSAPFYALVGAWTLIRDRRRGVALPAGSVWTKAFLVGLLGYWISSLCDFTGLEYITAQFGRVILFTYPLLVVLFGAAFFGQPIRAKALLAVGIGYLGIIVMFVEQVEVVGHDALVGSAFVFLAALTYAFYQLIAKNVMRAISPQLFTSAGMLAATLATCIQFALTHDFHALILPPKLIGIGLYLAIGATVLPTFFISAALHKIPASANSTIGMLSPVGTIFLAWMILGETLSPLAIAGTVLTLAGVSWFALSERKG